MTASPYAIREATTADIDVLVEQRTRMFDDMGQGAGMAALADEYRGWLGRMMPAGTYHGWLAEAADGGAPVAGAGLTVLPWPPGPHYPGGRVGFVYNVYTAPAHRRRGLARQLMAVIHDWCRAEGLSSLALNASQDGQPLYRTLGYAVATSPMMFAGLTPADRAKV